MNVVRTALLLGLLIAVRPLAAQREPVLRQIKVPHSYYYREMYLPQLTSGPSSLTWSPDGQELIYSMQGSLWRQRLGSTEARQLTTGPGYAYQPDWSPDGRHVVYAAYDRDAIELRLLDLSGGQTKSLVADGSVNVEPRWSPDGRRLAFVSSAFQGRWHIFSAPVADADYFIAWIERLEAAALVHKDWNTEQEKATALTAIRKARAEFERRKAR